MKIDKGLNIQGIDNTKASGSWVQGLNIEYTKDLKSITNCRGNLELGFSLPLNYRCIGTIDTPNEVILFLQGIDTLLGQQVNDVFAVAKLTDTNLDIIFKVPNHKINHEILGTYKYNYKDELIIIWCNGNYADSDNIRIINLDNLPFNVDANKFIQSDLTGVNFEITKINSNISYPLINFKTTNQNPTNQYDDFLVSGALKAGTYQFFLNYEKDGIKTNYFILTNEIILGNINENKLKDAFFWNTENGIPIPFDYTFNYLNNETTSNGIRLSLKNLDSKFEYYNIVCKYTNLSNVDIYYEVNRYSINDTTVIITSNPETTIEMSSIIDTINISKVHALTAYNNRLYIGNYSTDEEFDFQEYCYDVSLKLERNTDFFSDVSKITKSFQEGEVYAFYIHFVYKNGQTSKGFHIRGKEENGFGIAYNSTEKYSNGVGVTHYFIPYNTSINGFLKMNSKFGVGATNVESIINGIINDSNASEKIKEGAKNIKGYYLSYAKRTIDSSRILGTGILLNTDFVGNVSIKNTIGLNEKWTNDVQNYEGNVYEYVEENGSLGKFFYSQAYFKKNDYYNFYEYGLLNKKPQLNIQKIRLIYNTFDYEVNSQERNCKFLKYNPDNNSATNPSNINKEENISLEISDRSLIDKNILNSLFFKFELDDDVVPEDIEIINLIEGINGAWICQLINDEIVDYYYKFNEQKDLVKFTEVLPITSSRVSYNGDVFLSQTEFIKGWNLYHRMVYSFIAPNIFNPLLRQYYNENDTKIGLGTTNRVPINNSKYNEGFNKKATEKVNDAFNSDIFASNINSFKLNIARSRVQQSESLEETWIKFDALEYRTLDQKRSEIVSLKSDNRIIYAQTKNSLYVFQTKDEIQTANDIVASLGSADIFATSPIEILYNDKGLIGCNSRFSNILIPNGYIVFDSSRNNIFLVQNITPKLISNEISDLKKRWSTIEFEDSPAINYKGNRFVLDLTDNNNILYFLNYDGINTFNLSYNLMNGQFVSLHSFAPIVLCGDRKNMYGIEKIENNISKIYKYNQNNFSTYNSVVYPSYIDIVLSNDQVFKLQSIFWDSNFKDSNYVEKYNKTFSKIAVYNNKNCTGLLDLTSNRFKTNRGEKGLWYFNNIRDNVIDKNSMFIDKTLNYDSNGQFVNSNIADGQTKIKNFFDKSKFFSNFVVVRLYYDNVEQLNFYLNEINIKGQI